MKYCNIKLCSFETDFLTFELGKGLNKTKQIMEFSMEGYPTFKFLFCGIITLKHILYDTSNS